MQHVLFILLICITAGGVCDRMSRSDRIANSTRGSQNIEMDNFMEECLVNCPEEFQCKLGCSLWEQALDNSCPKICNSTDDGKESYNKILYCVMGCNDAQTRYFQWLTKKIGTIPAPALVADSLRSCSLALQWKIPSTIIEYAKNRSFPQINYLVQWRYAEVTDDWKFSHNQTITHNSTVMVENLKPYTKYRFRIVLLLSPYFEGTIVSQQSVIISTLASGVPSSKPSIVRIVAVDHTRISVSWEPGPFPNGPILSYVLLIRNLSSKRHVVIKDLPATEKENSFMCEKLLPNTSYSVMISMRNAAGEGPPAEAIISTLPAVNAVHREPESRLILGTTYAVSSQGPDILSESAEIFYESENRILGIAVHVEKGLIFVSDDAEFINKAPLKNKSRIVAIFTPLAGFDFSPQLLSIDWLNDHLYILGEVKTLESHPAWQIWFCDLNGYSLTPVITRLHKKPIHIHVDPFNGYIFWVVGGYFSDSGLFRLGLRVISNGVREDIMPVQVMAGENLGAFTVDYRAFRILIPVQDNNTVISVTFDGKNVEDIRKNTQSPKYSLVKSIDVVNDTFYWTDGNELYLEEHHLEEDSYYNNVYPDLTTNTIVAVRVYSPSAQPTPIPVNPPRNVQALLSSAKAKLLWDVPHLLANQDAGAWQNWSYELQIIDESSYSTDVTHIRTTYYLSEKLKPNTSYKFRVAAYSPSGKGPWSTVFRSKTLRSMHERLLIWVSNDGLLQSDVIGEHVDSLISKSALGEDEISDVAWHDDVLFFVSNSTLKIYNRTSGQMSKLKNVDAVGSIGIDWIGRRVYWSNPTQQSMFRANFDGNDLEILPILAVVRELRLDSVWGFLYFSTGHAVEVCRLNGKNRIAYFNVHLYSGKEIVGLTLDMDNEQILWIVRSYEGFSLFNAPMAHKWHKDVIPKEIKLDEHSINGPLIYFSDRLLWLQDDHTAIIGDMNGKNLAFIKNKKLRGLRSVSVIDPTYRVSPNISTKLSMVPEKINANSIRIDGTWDRFTIEWAPITSVAYGEIFYDIKIRSKVTKDIVAQGTSSFLQCFSLNIPPYSLLEIIVKSFTYWATSESTYVRLRSPSATPSAPTKPRIFITHYQNPIVQSTNITASFRWEDPSIMNGPIVGYKVFCLYNDRNQEKDMCSHSYGIQKQITVSNLMQNTTYSFQVQAATSAGKGMKTAPLIVNSSNEHAPPMVIVASNSQISSIDVDLNITKRIVHTGSQINHIALIQHENLVIWTNANNELMTFKEVQVKLFTGTEQFLSLTVDWVTRIIYWSQTEKGGGSSVYSFDLNRHDQWSTFPEKMISRSGLIVDLTIVPTHQILYWIELKDGYTSYGELGQFHLEFTRTAPPSPDAVCSNGLYKHLMVDIRATGEYVLMLIGLSNQIFIYDLQKKQCQTIKLNHKYNTMQIAKDGSHLYVLANGTIHGYNNKLKLEYVAYSRYATRILSFNNQIYPQKQCLIPKQAVSFTSYTPKLMNKTDNSLILQLPKPEIHSKCITKLAGVKYVISYSERQHRDLSNCSHECKKIVSYNRLLQIKNLKPYTNYIFQIGVSNFYCEKFGINPVYGPVISFTTSPGAPSEPRNVTAEAMSPTEAIIKWFAPLQINSDNLWFQVYWQTENPINRVVNTQQRVVVARENLYTRLDKEITTSLSKLRPGHNYVIWIEAFTSNYTSSVSTPVNMQTFPEPDNITLIEATSYKFRLQWKMHKNISKYLLQYITTKTRIEKAVANGDNNEGAEKTLEFVVDGLRPKTTYTFFLRLCYAKFNASHIWPSDTRFTFETLGDKPSAPGTPFMYHVSDNVYKITWNPAIDNGAHIEEYSLEALPSKDVNQMTRTTVESGSVNKVELNNNITPANEVASLKDAAPFDDQWFVYYRGSDPYFIIKDFQLISLYSLRVRAKNFYGWGPYSPLSDPVSAALVSPSRRDSLMFAVVIPLTLLITCVSFLGCLIYAIRRQTKLKKLFGDRNSCIPGFELANLRELPHAGHLVHTNNILYNSVSHIGADLSLLPRFKKNQITMIKFLGSGAFGEVYEGCVKNFDSDDEIRVAIKTLRKGASVQEKSEFFQEAQLMSNFKHEHILRLIGICLDSESLYILMELMLAGDLLSYLRQSRPTIGLPHSLSLFDLVSMCVDVASGCQYLEEMHFVHRDLACRNCLVSSEDRQHRVVKIGDFGLARDIYKNDYYRKEGEGLLPVRWMSPESLVDGVFTCQSDIWAFGVLCWEIMTLGQQPYPARNNLEVLQYVRDGGRLGKPVGCPEELYQLMLKCWSYSPGSRPSFKYCLEILVDLKANVKNLLTTVAQETMLPMEGAQEFTSNGTMPTQSVNHPRISPTSYSTGGTAPKYLDVLYDETFEDGYEVPISLGKNKYSGSMAGPSDYRVSDKERSHKVCDILIGNRKTSATDTELVSYFTPDVPRSANK